MTGNTSRGAHPGIEIVMVADCAPRDSDGREKARADPAGQAAGREAYAAREPVLRRQHDVKTPGVVGDDDCPSAVTAPAA